MNTDTPPQPAHGEPWIKWAFKGLEDVVDETGYIVIHDAHYITPTLTDRIIACVNLLAPHPDLSAVEVHSKETMDEVRAALDLFGKIFALQKPAPLGGWNWDQLASQSTDALAKLNPPL